MSTALDGCWAKVQRAKETIQALNREVAQYLGADPKPYKIVGAHHNGDMEFGFTAFADAPPLRFSVIALGAAEWRDCGAR